MQKLEFARPLVAVAVAVGAIAGASAYIHPWYVNPTLRLRVNNSLAAGVTPCSADAAGDWFVMANDAEGAANLRTLTADTVFGRDITADDVTFGADSGYRLTDGTLTNLFTHSGCGRSTDYGLSAAPLVAVDAANGRFLAAKADLSAVRLFNLNRDKWGVGAGAANAPATITADGASETASALAFSPDGTKLVANHVSGTERGKISVWTLAGTTLTKGSDLDTGLSAVGGLSAVRFDETDYAVVGEGSAESGVATKGQIRLVRLSDGAVSTLVNDPTQLTGGIVSVRTSHADDFRPRIYALLESGDVVCYYYRKENGTMHWTATLTNAELLTRCKAPYGASEAKVTQFAVAGSGEVALLGYRLRSGAAAANRLATYAFLYHTATPWTYYAAGATGNPCSTNGACITDGKWVLTMANTTMIGAVNACGAAYDGPYMGEVLDLSAGVATDSATATTKYTLNMNNNWALGTNTVGRGPRVLIVPSKHTEWTQFTKGWWGDGNYEEVVIGFRDCTGWNPWAGMSGNIRRVVVNCPNMSQIRETSLYGNNGISWGDLAKWEDINFPIATSFGKRAVGLCFASGKLTLPKVQTIGQEAFFAAKNMTELSLAADTKSLKSVGSKAFGLMDGQAGGLKRVVLGCAPDCTFAKQVFYKQPIEEIVFTGAKPTVEGSSGLERWSDEKEKQLTFVVPRTAEWENTIAGKWTALTDAERQAFHVAHPGRYVPFGLLETSAMESGCKQYVAYSDDTGYCTLKVERDEFFADDEVTITADHAAAADGTYLKGTKVKLTAKPGATGTFHKWYGGPFAGTDEAAKSATVTVTLDEDTWLYCRIVHPWTLAADKKTMSNGNFTLNCNVNNSEGKRTLSIATSSKCGLYAANDTGYGVCDMGGDILLAGDSATWAITSWNISGGSLCSERGGKGNARALLMPLTAESMPGSQSLHGTSGFWFTRSYETLILDCPKAAGTIWSGWWTCGQYRLQHVVLQAPKFTAFNGDGYFWNVPMRETKFDWWYLPALREIPGKSLGGYDWGHSCGLASGTLRLPALRATMTADGNQALRRIKKMTALSLGGATKATTVTTILNNSFIDCTSVKTVTLHNDANMTVGDLPFSGCAALKEIVLTGKPFTSETPFSKLLGGVTAATTKPMKVYVSAYMGWGTRPAWLDEPTAAERAEAPGETVLGVYRGGATSPSGKALVLHRASPFDPKGACLLLR